MVLKRICAWCGKELDPASIVPAGAETTHGICPPCGNLIFSRFGIRLRDLIDRLEVPVTLVNEAGMILAANKHTRTLAGKDLSIIEGHPPGEVFQCVYAVLPGGCGGTVHCSGCVIRKSVAETAATGKSISNVPATLNQQAREIRFLISTEKAGESVLLQIEDIHGEEHHTAPA